MPTSLENLTSARLPEIFQLLDRGKYAASQTHPIANLISYEVEIPGAPGSQRGTLTLTGFAWDVLTDYTTLAIADANWPTVAPPAFLSVSCADLASSTYSSQNSALTGALQRPLLAYGMDNEIAGLDVYTDAQLSNKAYLDNNAREHIWFGPMLWNFLRTGVGVHASGGDFVMEMRSFTEEDLTVQVTVGLFDNDGTFDITLL